MLRIINSRQSPTGAQLDEAARTRIDDFVALQVEKLKAKRLAREIDAQCRSIRDGMNEIADMSEEEEQELNNRILIEEGNCPHMHVTVTWYEVARATRWEPAENEGVAECNDCGETMAPEDVPDEAERTEKDGHRQRYPRWGLSW